MLWALEPTFIIHTRLPSSGNLERTCSAERRAWGAKFNFCHVWSHLVIDLRTRSLACLLRQFVAAEIQKKLETHLGGYAEEMDALISTRTIGQAQLKQGMVMRRDKRGWEPTVYHRHSARQTSRYLQTREEDQLTTKYLGDMYNILRVLVWIVLIVQ